MFDKTYSLLNAIKTNKPLILNITNYVTMDFIANGLLSLGASPVMSHAEKDIPDLLNHAEAVVVNLGTLDDTFISLCKQTCEMANQLDVPIILDPVGAGASQYRTDINLTLMNEFKIAIIRGNASEILALAGTTQKIKGVDSLIETHSVINSAKKLSKQYDTTIAISGKMDVIIDNDDFAQLECGSPLMPTITGTGCLLSAVIAAFHALEKNRFEAAKLATLFYGICGEIAEQKSYGPGSFKANFLDALSFLPKPEQYEQ